MEDQEDIMKTFLGLIIIFGFYLGLTFTIRMIIIEFIKANRVKRGKKPW